MVEASRQMVGSLSTVGWMWTRTFFLAASCGWGTWTSLGAKGFWKWMFLLLRGDFGL